MNETTIKVFKIKHERRDSQVSLGSGLIRIHENSIPLNLSSQNSGPETPSVPSHGTSFSSNYERNEPLESDQFNRDIEKKVSE